MKSLLTIAVIAIVAWFAWQKLSGQSGPPASLEDPVYGEVRVSLEVQDRELEMALFIRASSNADCRGRAAVSWNELFKDCPSCELQEPVCRDELPARYARLFDDAPPRRLLGIAEMKDKPERNAATKLGIDASQLRGRAIGGEN